MKGKNHARSTDALSKLDDSKDSVSIPRISFESPVKVGFDASFASDHSQSSSPVTANEAAESIKGESNNELLDPNTNNNSSLKQTTRHKHQPSNSSAHTSDSIGKVKSTPTSPFNFSASSDTGGFKLPLTKLKQKLFFKDDSESEAVETVKSIGGDEDEGRRTPSEISSGAQSPVSRPFPMLRSLSSQSQSRDDSTESIKSQDSPVLLSPTSSTRPRSRTLNSLNEAKASNSALSSFPRSSLGSLLTSRLRNESDPLSVRRPSPSPRQSVGYSSSVQDFHNLLLEKEQDESVDSYLTRLKEAKVGSAMVAALSLKHEDSFYATCLQRYVDSFDFADDPIDMALRKFLMYAKLPKETQQIDRVLQCFARTYYNANSDIYLNSENAYFVVFSLMILHTDFFNKNNRHKMQKSDYVRNTCVKGIPNEVLEVSL